MARYIEDTEVKLMILRRGWMSEKQLAESDVVNNLPTADVAEVRHGRWIYTGVRGRFPVCRCSECGALENADWAVIQNEADYCPHCGARMDAQGRRERMTIDELKDKIDKLEEQINRFRAALAEAEKPKTVKLNVAKYIPMNHEIEISGITLLTVEEAQALPDEIRRNGYSWWLRSPGSRDNDAACVYGYGLVNDRGYNVDYSGFGVRPALICNLESSNLEIGDRIEIFGHDWTAIGNDKILCDRVIEKRRFDEKTNDWEKSELKAWLEEWFAEQVKEGGAEIKRTTGEDNGNAAQDVLMPCT